MSSLPPQALEKVAAYMKSPRFLKMPINNKMAKWGNKKEVMILQDSTGMSKAIRARASLQHRGPSGPCPHLPHEPPEEQLLCRERDSAAARAALENPACGTPVISRYSFWLDLVHVRNAETDRGATTDTAINYEISGYQQNWMSRFFQTFRAARRGDPDVQGDDSPGFHGHVQGHQGQVTITLRGDGQTHLSMRLDSKDASVPVTIDPSCEDCGSCGRKCRGSLWPW
ncbi:uncharacterized protein LOC128854451 [Cuculus canorus]|uniref:uncharacterized protein LOC128854451 n=1 Tax=Cuculus canorus TaxID=55661 RepID=UPI0023AB0DD2|nr:uncharacterized protein LOC128854451 [Cuculus canorus]